MLNILSITIFCGCVVHIIKTHDFDVVDYMVSSSSFESIVVSSGHVIFGNSFSLLKKWFLNNSN